MKKSILSVAAALALPVLADPTVGSVSLSVNDDKSVVEISYTLSGEAAVVTVDIQTNALADATGEWVSIGGEGTGVLGGYANRLVETVDTPVKAYWFPNKSFPDRQLAAGQLKAVVTAWPKAYPPDYMVVNLTSPTNVVRFYTSTNALPGGFANLDYKTTKLLMRKIPAKNVVWRMGLKDGYDDKKGKSDEGVYNTLHYVLLTEDYYIGVFEVTVGQYNLFGTQTSRLSFTDQVDADFLPAQRMTYTSLRGTTETAPCQYMWPESGHTVKAGSTLDNLRKICGIADVDLPTEAQWEYAGHGGTGTPFYTGKTWSDAELNRISCNPNNASHVVYLKDGTSKTRSCPRPVGSYPPNDFGLYDILGNVSEFCLDRNKSNDAAGAADYQSNFQPGWESGAVTTNPVSCTDTSVARACKRGGAWLDELRLNQVGFRNLAGLTWTGDNGYIGFRLCCSVTAAVK